MPEGKWVSKANLQTFWQSIRSKLAPIITEEVNNVLPTAVGDNVTAWLTEHVDPVGSAVVVDDTLTIAGAAADAKKTGDEISGLKEELSAIGFLNEILINGENYYNSNIVWEQGNFTSTNPNVDSDYDVRTGYFQNGGYILNHNRIFNFAVALFSAEGTFDRYINIGTVAGYSTNFWKDELLYLPPLKVGFYRIRACKVSENTGTKVLLNANDCDILLYSKNNHEFWSVGILTSSGFAFQDYGVVSNPISDCNYIKIKKTDSNIKYALYSTEDETTYSIITSGFATDDNYILPVEKGKKYFVRAGVVNATPANKAIEAYSSYINGIEVEKLDSLWGYTRDYDDITHLLTFERKSISSQGITDSTIDIIAKLPNNGNVEVKINAPMGKFAVYKVASDSTISPMTDGWSHYQFRYTGDYSSSYYVRVRYEAEGTILPEIGAQILRVYMYSDFGHKNDLYTTLLGKNIAFFGDSIVQGRFAKNNGSVNLCMAKPYSILISEIIGDLTPINYGIGGATVYDADWKSLYRNVSNVNGYDVVFVCAGTNDYGQNVSSDNFTSAFTYVITQLLAHNTSVIVCTPTARRTMTANTAGLTLQDYANIEKTIAANNNLKVIDLLSITNNAVFLNTLPDGLHPNEIGHGMLANAIIDNYDLT